MSLQLQRVRVDRLFGLYDLDVPITDNVIILVGENGSGKSTLIRGEANRVPLLPHLTQWDCEAVLRPNRRARTLDLCRVATQFPRRHP